MTMDHFLIYWGLCGVIFIFDTILRKTGMWKTIKLHNSVIPDTWFNIVTLVLFNQIFISTPLIYFFSINYTQDINLLYLPLQIPLLILIFEIFFYYTHRALHHPLLYPRVHKIHHRWVYPSAVSTFYAHPLEHALTNVIPVALSAYLVGLPFSLVRLWHLLALSNGIIVSHGGYDLGKNFHDDHHVYVTCNYGAFGFLDTFYGTKRIA